MNHWKRSFVITLAILFFIIPIMTFSQASRDRPMIVGSSTVYPLAEKVGRQFSENSGMPAPELKSTGTGGGMKLFCEGTGPQTPDIVNASRPIKSSEVELCAQNGVNEIIDVTVGYDAIVVVRAAGATQPLNLTRKELFLAFAKDVPDPQGGTQLVPNPYQNWTDINPDLPSHEIKGWGPDKTHGTHDLIMSNIMSAGCQQLEVMQTLEQANPADYRTACQSFRQDGAYTEHQEYQKILEAVKSDPEAVGIVGYLFLVNDPGLQASEIDGVMPNAGSIAHKIYPLTRPLRFYLKKAHIDVVPGLREFVAEFTSERAWGASRGYLVELGMIPMPRKERRQAKVNFEELKPL
ncbi:MAG: substrate-binding domain-containing protein [Candidatus Competibacteraceae bacterium]|nr:substrate-binding domain-containing protein [Candidatus Competibacteraceae bacterium]